MDITGTSQPLPDTDPIINYSPMLTDDEKLVPGAVKYHFETITNPESGHSATVAVMLFPQNVPWKVEDLTLSFKTYAELMLIRQANDLEIPKVSIIDASQQGNTIPGIRDYLKSLSDIFQNYQVIKPEHRARLNYYVYGLNSERFNPNIGNMVMSTVGANVKLCRTVDEAKLDILNK